MTRKTLGAIFAIALLPTFVMAGSDTGADFLKVPIGARAIGLGSAYTALANDSNALNWNPAGIAKLNAFAGTSFSHQKLFEDTDLNHFNAAIRLRNSATVLGFSVTHVSFADQQGRDVNRQKTGSVGARDFSLGLAIARGYGGLHMGTQVKLIRQDLAGETAQGIAFDLGILSKTPVPKLSLGASVRHLGPKMKFIDEKFDLPVTMSFGGAYRLIDSLTLAMDLHYHPHQNQVVFAIGSEIGAVGPVSLRAGYGTKLADAIANTQKPETTRGTIKGLSGATAGLGLQLKNFSLDYAISPFGELGNTQTLTFSGKFGASFRPANTNHEFSRDFSTPRRKKVDEHKEQKENRSILILHELPESRHWWDRTRNRKNESH